MPKKPVKVMTEPEWTNELINYVRANLYIRVRSLDGGTFGANGWPDRLLVSKEGIFLLEFKGVRTPVGPLQKEILKDLSERQRGKIFIVRKNHDTTKAGRIINPEDGETVAIFLGKEDFWDALLRASRKLTETSE